MTKKNSLKKALITSALSMVLCSSMLVGTTYAWFTDSVTSTGNVIQTGTLDVTMEWKDATANGAQQTYKDASEGAIFNYDKWEPGYVEAKNIKIGNAGTLALKYQLAIVPNGEVSELADVIDVYFINEETTVTREAIAAAIPVGTLREMIEDPDGAAYGYLLPKGATATVGTLEAVGEQTVTIALKMREEAGNDYQDMSIGTNFSVQLLATQYTYEKDSIDENYDAGTSFDDVIFVHGGTYNMTADRYESINISADAEVIINGNDKAIIVNGAGFQNSGEATVNDAKINAGNASNYSNITIGADAQTTYNNVTVKSAGGGIGAANGAEVIFNSGSVEVNSTSTSGRYLFYAEGEGTVITINGGDFADFTKTSQNQKRAYIYAGAGTTVYVNGGTFGKASTREDYKAGILGTGTVIITGGTFGFDPTNWVADGYVSEKDNANGTWTVKPHVVSTADELKKVLDDANGATATVIDAQGANVGAFNAVLKTENVPAGTTVTIRNAVVEGRSYGNKVDGTVIFENCTFTNTGAYSIHFDGGSGNIVFNNCKMDGWCSFGSAIKSVEMNGCTFTGNDTYALLRFYQDVTLTNCTFDCSNANTTDNEYFPEGIDMVEGYTATVINCTNVNGEMSELFSEHDLEGTDGIVKFQ